MIAPYLLTALIERPPRLIYLSSGLHRRGRPALSSLGPSEGPRHLLSYSDSKLFVTTLAAAVAGRWPEVFARGRPRLGAHPHGRSPRNRDLELGHVTQAWLAVSSDPAALASGHYWYHKRKQPAHRAVHDPQFQAQLIARLRERTGVVLP